MHASLSPKFNIVFLAAWIVGALAVSLFAPVVPSILLTLGAFLGAALGMTQLRAIRGSRIALIASQSERDVRRALAATGSGRAYRYGLWGSASLILAAAYTLPSGGQFHGSFAGYFALSAVRELITLREAFVLQALSTKSTT